MSYIVISGYTVYVTLHPSNNAHGGSAIIIKSTLRHHELQEYKTYHLQATTIEDQDWYGPLVVSATYCPPRQLLVYKTILKPIWTYGIQLWGTASKSNTEIIQRFQNKVLRVITNAPWYTRNSEVHDYLNIPLVEDEIKKFSSKYQDRLQGYFNHLAINLLDNSETVRRLKRQHILDLS
ncbi:hypothetical protein M8J76_016194 [Diaphorina citri]|nr:hypothetical protein M8J76_016194 [Diaphorina citri]